MKFKNNNQRKAVMAKLRAEKGFVTRGDVRFSPVQVRKDLRQDEKILRVLKNREMRGVKVFNSPSLKKLTGDGSVNVKASIKETEQQIKLQKALLKKI
jgi:hypothetical protein